MRIAVIDDLESDRSRLENALKLLLSNNSVNGEIYKFKKGIDFINAAKEMPFEVAFMDIYIDKENGVEISKLLREFDNECILIFTTTSKDHALEGFRVRAFDYLVKPYSDADLKNTFGEILKRLPSTDKYIELRIVGGTEKIRINDIIYAEHFKHCINIHKKGGKTTVVRITFSEFSKMLENESRFFMCNRGVIINYEYATDFDGTQFILTDGTKISVSRSLTKSAKNQFADYIFNKR